MRAGKAKTKAQRVQAIYEAYFGRVARIIPGGRQARAIRRDQSADTVAMMWLGLVQSPATRWPSGGGRFDLRNRYERAGQAIADAIRAKCLTARSRFTFTQKP